MPTVADIKPLDEALLDLTLGDFIAHQALTVVPLLASPHPEPDWLTLAEAGGKVTITEVSEAGHVPVLGVTNDAERPLLLLHGEERVSSSVLVAAHSTLNIPLTCVERGAGHASEQNEILAATRVALAPRPGQVGALVFVSGRWIGLDLLPSPALFAHAWSRLCAGYATDALGARARRPRTVAAAEVLSRLAVAPLERAEAVGLGDELRLGGTLGGAALIADGVVAHLRAFPAVIN